MSRQQIRQKKRKTGPNISWQNRFVPIVKAYLEKTEETIRSMYYILCSKYPKEIPNTPSTYSSYDQAMTRARKQGKLPDDAFIDDTRRIIDIYDTYETPEDYLGRGAAHIFNAYEKYTIPRWQGQPNYVEVWIEKAATQRTFYSILKKGEMDREVRIVPNRGVSSYTFFMKNIRRLKDKVAEGKSVYILYFGDYDPSGTKMSYNIAKYLEDSGLDSHIHFKRIAVAKWQIREYELEYLQNPEPETLDKLEDDNNTEWFKDNHDGAVFQIELEALRAEHIQERFKKLVLDTVDKLFDDAIYQKEVVQKQAEERRRIINGLDNKAALDLLATIKARKTDGEHD